MRALIYFFSTFIFLNFILPDAVILASGAQSTNRIDADSSTQSMEDLEDMDQSGSYELFIREIDSLSQIILVPVPAAVVESSESIEWELGAEIIAPERSDHLELVIESGVLPLSAYEEFELTADPSVHWYFAIVQLVLLDPRRLQEPLEVGVELSFEISARQSDGTKQLIRAEDFFDLMFYLQVSDGGSLVGSGLQSQASPNSPKSSLQNSCRLNPRAPEAGLFWIILSFLILGLMWQRPLRAKQGGQS